MRLPATIAKALVAAVLLAIPFLQHAAEPLAAQPAVSESERTYRDFSFSPDQPDGAATSLRVRLASPLPRDKVRAVTIYLKSGDGWYAVPVGAADAFCGARAVRISLQGFAPEGKPGAIVKSSLIRVSAWKRADFTNEIVLAEAAFDGPARIAIVRSTERSAPGETALASELADRCASIVGKTGRDFDFISDEDFARLKAKGRDKALPSLAFLPYSPALPDDDAKSLVAFAEAGGRLVVFCCANRKLGKALGVEPGPWRSSGKRAFTAMDCEPLLGGQRRIPHFTEGVIPPHPLPNGGAEKIATWITEYAKPTRQVAATLAPCGAWFAHIPPRAYPAAVDFLDAIMTDLGEPKPDGESASADASLALPQEKCPSLAAWANAPDIPAAYADRLAGLGIEALYVRRKPTDVSEPAKIPGVAVHAWISCFTTEGLPPDVLERLKRENRLSATNPSWMEPSVKANGEITIRQLVKAAKSGVAGIHLDYVRTSSATPQSAEATAAITEFVREASKAVRKAKPGIVLSAAVFGTPESAAHHNQDWPTWLEERLVDYVCPMTYTESSEEFAGYLGACLAVAPAEKLRPGIGTGANESQVDAATAAAELAEIAKAGCPEAIFFTLNDSLIEVLEAFKRGE